VAEIRMRAIAKSFGDVIVLKDLELTIADGEFFTFVGPSGCGKSTILNIIAGLETPDRGRLIFDGKDVTGLAPRERDVAMVFQSYALYPHMTVAQNIAFPLKMRKVPSKSINAEVDRMVSLLGLENLAQRKPAELSGGQRQRVAVARALVRKPKVFLLDEPFSNLDAQLRLGMRGEIKKLQRELGVTTIFVTHDQGEAMSLSDRMAVLYEGTVQQCGPPVEVYSNPATLFVGHFIGSPPMNLIEGVVEDLSPLRISCGGISLTLSRERMANVPLGTPVIAGIRPDDINITMDHGGALPTARVLLVEPAGPFGWVDVAWCETTVKGRAAAEAHFNPDNRVNLNIREDRIVLFDRSTGMRIHTEKDE
jgi:multiple sugar transport system ATP-binding protein